MVTVLLQNDSDGADYESKQILEVKMLFKNDSYIYSLVINHVCMEQVLATSKIHILNCEKFQDYGS